MDLGTDYCYAGVRLALLRSLTQGVRRVLGEMSLRAQLLARRVPFERRGETITPPGRRQRLPGVVRGHLPQIITAATRERGYHNH